MLNALNRHNRPVLWLDADSEVVAPLPIFDNPSFDFAATRGVGGVLRSGTVYAAPAARGLLALAARLCEQNPHLGHEKNLDTAYRRCRGQLRTKILDHGYNRVPDQRLPKGSWAGTVYILSNHKNGSGYHAATFPSPPPNRRPVGKRTLRTVIASFHVDDEGAFYRSAAKRLETRCRDIGIACDIVEGQSYGGWIENCLQKPRCILEALDRHKRPVLWVDCDARMHFGPWLCDDLTCDVAAVPYNGSPWNDPPLRIRSAVVWFNDTPGARAFLKRWREMCERPVEGVRVLADHHYLEMTWREFEASGKCTLGHMPEAMAFCVGDATDKGIQPIISIGLAKGIKSRRDAMARMEQIKRQRRDARETVAGSQ
ncbi:MAG: hypothetical protein WC378_15120 [Opitutaceae bacterium]|jgi:hypothetical protein